MDGISAYGGYRDQWASNLTNTRTGETEETEGTEGTEGTSQNWDAVFTDDADNGVTIDDFLTLMVAQLKNQDFMNPVDDTQYVTQLAQFTTMQQMQEMASYMKTNYVMSLVGKNVTAAKISVSGELQKEIGQVEKISLVNNEYAVYVNGKRFSLEQIMEINSSDSAQNGDEVDTATSEYLLSLIGKEVTVRQRDEDGEPAEKLTGVVERISTEDGAKVCIDGEWYPLEDVLEVGGASDSQENPDDSGTNKPEEKAAWAAQPQNSLQAMSFFLR